MKYCAHCSREYPDSSTFCTQCGLPLTEGPAAPAVETAAAVPVVEAAAAEPAVEEAPTIVEAAPASIEIRIPVPEEPATPAPAAVAVAEAPPAPPVFTPQEKIRRGGEKISVIRKIGAFFLCVLLFLFLLIPAMIYQVRDASTEAWLSNYLDKVSLSDQIDLDDFGYVIEEWLQDLDPELEDVELDLRDAGSEIDRFIKNADIKAFAAEKLAAYLDAIYSGVSGAVLTEDDVYDLLDENNALINEQLTEMVDELFGSGSGISVRISDSEREDLAERIFSELKDSDAYTYLRTKTLREEAPVVYYALSFGFSYIAAGVSLVLAVAVFFFLLKTLKSALRAANRSGIVLIVLGGLLSLLALVPKMDFLSDAWLSLFSDIDALALFAGDFLYTHLLVDLGILGAGVLLTAVTGLALLIRKKRAAQ